MAVVATMPDSPVLLVSRIETLLHEIGRVETSLHDVDLRFDPDLRERVVGRLERDLNTHRARLSALRDRVGAEESLTEGYASLRPIQRELSGVFGECLAFLEGALARQHGLDNGLCAIADDLLEELSRRSGVSWDRFTILADGEFYEALSDMIRLRFSDTSIWNLPIMAHEFGHFAGPRIEVQGERPFERILKREQRMSPARDRQVHEAFADVFATYVLGPAYLCACLLRFDPVTAFADATRHPASAKRLRIMLATLTRKDAGDGVFAGVCAGVEAAWSAATRGAGHEVQGIPVADGELQLATVDGWADELHDVLDRTLNRGAVFDADRWLRAQQLSAALRNDRRMHRDRLPKLDGDDTLAVVLNAAWHARWIDWDGTASYAATARALCEEIGRAGP